ncbi:hypothetical protein [Streptococcus ovuberis]|uniref:Uncharacterized protein n=1 Tax=Streptococcus ovuberis TaxID=1936207 RepID=A0A7X6N0T4_9STRE|nr:hypothetical protein [Streptococcus ovuberis]NKZ19974.1 hypothetical protein [Streptococcus ovuberis]
MERTGLSKQFLDTSKAPLISAIICLIRPVRLQGINASVAVSFQVPMEHIALLEQRVRANGGVFMPSKNISLGDEPARCFDLTI